MAIYKHLTDENIAKALDRLFKKFEGAWINETAVSTLVMLRYFPLPEPSKYHATYQDILKVLKGQAKAGKYQYRYGSYRPIQSLGKQ